jgi:hypothetical protein
MAALLIGYACCSTDQQDLTAQFDGLTALGVSPTRIYVDHGLTGTRLEGARALARMSGRASFEGRVQASLSSLANPKTGVACGPCRARRGGG